MAFCYLKTDNYCLFWIGFVPKKIKRTIAVVLIRVWGGGREGTLYKNVFYCSTFQHHFGVWEVSNKKTGKQRVCDYLTDGII